MEMSREFSSRSKGIGLFMHLYFNPSVYMFLCESAGSYMLWHVCKHQRTGSGVSLLPLCLRQRFLFGTVYTRLADL